MRYCEIINYVTVVNFKESSYEVMEGRDEVVIMIEVSQSSPKPFEVMISLMDDTAKSKIMMINYQYSLYLGLLQMKRIIERHY